MVTPDWSQRACRHVPVETMFPEAVLTRKGVRDEARVRNAKDRRERAFLRLLFERDGVERLVALHVCGPCPIRENCLEYALEHGLEGVWGGTSLEQRRRIRITRTEDRHRRRGSVA